jgi:hypothetical protein
MTSVDNRSINERKLRAIQADIELGAFDFTPLTSTDISMCVLS